MKKVSLMIALAALTLAGCQQEAKAPEQGPSGEMEAKPGLAVTEGRLVLPAVTGNPGVAYFTLANEGDKGAELAAISIEGVSKAEIHETKDGKMAAVKAVPLAKGATASFAPGGIHVMLFDLDAKLAAGSKAEMTLTFADGDKLSAPLTIEAAGSDEHQH